MQHWLTGCGSRSVSGPEPVLPRNESDSDQPRLSVAWQPVLHTCTTCTAQPVLQSTNAAVEADVPTLVTLCPALVFAHLPAHLTASLSVCMSVYMSARL